MLNKNKPITFNSIEKGILKDLLKIHIKGIIKQQEKTNKRLKKKGLLNEFEPIKNLDKHDCYEFKYIETLEKISNKLNLSKKQNIILDNLYN